MDLVDAPVERRKVHTFRGVEEKRRIVEETLRSGVSVSSVARAHGINANQVFQWRKLYRDGLLDGTGSGMRLLPVALSDGDQAQAAGSSPVQSMLQPERQYSPGGSIELVFDWGQLRITGSVDAEALRTVLGCLLT